MGVTTQRGLSLGEVPVMRFAIPAMLLLSLAGCAEADSASLRFDADTLRLLRQDRAQCREQCRAETKEADCTVDDSTGAPSCPRQHLACHVRCPPVATPGQQTPPLVPRPDPL
jgi:hypothetical protein